jgi:hypothetical protein
MSFSMPIQQYDNNNNENNITPNFSSQFMESILRGGMCGNNFSGASNLFSISNSHNTTTTTNLSQKQTSFSLGFSLGSK